MQPYLIEFLRSDTHCFFAFSDVRNINFLPTILPTLAHIFGLFGSFFIFLRFLIGSVMRFVRFRNC